MAQLTEPTAATKIQPRIRIGLKVTKKERRENGKGRREREGKMENTAPSPLFLLSPFSLFRFPFSLLSRTSASDPFQANRFRLPSARRTRCSSRIRAVSCRREG